MPAARMPAAEVHIDAGLVGRLVAAQFPRWAGLEITPVVTPGWDNALFRLGPELVVRLPRRGLAAELVDKEQRWLPVLAPRLPLPVPVPVAHGMPAAGYPWRWSVCHWLAGRRATDAPVDDDAAAAALGAFLSALHQPAPADAPRNPWRGVPLAERDLVTRRDIAAVSDLVDATTALRAWEEALSGDPWTGPPVWIHGDLHPANLLVADGVVRAVLDFGDLAAGDPATDLAVAWMLLRAPARPLLQAASGADDATWARGRGWAVALGLACLAHSADNPVVAGIGRRALAAVLGDAALR